MEHHLCARAFLDELDEVGVDGFEDVPVHLRGDHEVVLCAQIVADLDDVDVVTQFSEEAPHQCLALFGYPLE